ncbi:MAG TPA: hypothetical protein VFD01_19305 [Candidatus Dormibacteraeota bacterium]|nr:hypothetical protein [Candidatus Dormibacteraeota bacterium]
MLHQVMVRLGELELPLALSDLRSARPDAALARLDSLDTPEALYWKGWRPTAGGRQGGAVGDLARAGSTPPHSPWAVRTTLLQLGGREHPVGSEGS